MMKIEKQVDGRFINYFKMIKFNKLMGQYKTGVYGKEQLRCKSTHSKVVEPAKEEEEYQDYYFLKGRVLLLLPVSMDHIQENGHK